MRNKKLLVTVVVMLLIAFILSFTLAACKEKEDDSDSDELQSGWVDDPMEDDPQPTKPPTYATNFKDAVGYMVAATPDEYLSLNFNGWATLRGKRYKMSLKGNLSDDDMQVSMTFKSESSNELAFGLYITNSKLFLELEDGTLYNVAEINVDYLASIIDKVPDKVSGLIPDNYKSLIPFALDILLGGLSPADQIKYSAENGVEKFELAIDVQGLTGTIDSVIALVKMMGLLGDDLDLSFVSELLGLIPLINGQLKATVDNGRLSEFNLELYDNDPNSETYRQTMAGVDSAVTFSSAPLQLDIPEGLENYEPMTLGNLNFDVTFDLDTHGEPFDLGALIDQILPLIGDKDADSSDTVVNSIPTPLFGEGILVLDGNAEYKLDVRASLDPNLDGLDKDDNYINIVLRAGETELIRANYLDGKIYVKAFADGGISLVSFVIDFDLKQYITMFVGLVTDAIDNLLGTEFAPAASAVMYTASINENGEAVLTPSLQSVITSILKLVGFDEYVELSGNKITVPIDKDLMDKIFEMANIDPIELPFIGELVIGLFGGGIDYVEISAMEDLLTLRVGEFKIGKAQITRQTVSESIGDIKAYSSDIKCAMLSMLDDADLTLELDVSTIDTTVNLTPIINNIMTIADQDTYLKMPIALDLSKYDGTFTINLATNYKETVNNRGSVIANSNLLLEVKTPAGDTLISAYNENSDTYIDLTGLGFMKFCLTNVNIFQKLRGMFGADVLMEDYQEAAADVFNSAYPVEIEIDSSKAGIAVDNYFVTVLMQRFLSKDLGLDVDLSAKLNINGTVSAEIGLGNTAKLGLGISLGKASDRPKTIKAVVAEIRESESQKGTEREYGIYNAVNAEMLVDSIFVAQHLYLTLDLYNQNVDNTNGSSAQMPNNVNNDAAKSRIVIRHTTARKKGQTERLPNGLEAPYKSIVLAIYAGWTSEDSDALIFGYIDIDNKKVQIKGTAKLLNIEIYLIFTKIKLTGELVDVPIPNVDIKGMLVDALSGLFGNSNTLGDGELPSQKPNVQPYKCQHACTVCGKCTDADSTDSHCSDKCGKAGSHSDECEHACPTCGKCTDREAAGGNCNTKCEKAKRASTNIPDVPSHSIEEIIPSINITLTGSFDVDIDVDVNGKYVSSVLNNMLTKLFDDMDISSITENDSHKHQHVEYNNKDAGTFFSSLWTNVLKPLVTKYATSLGAGAADLAGVDDQLKKTVQRFLPISNVDDVKINASVTDGKLANITIIGSNKAENNTDKGFRIYVLNKNADDVVSWENQATNIYYNTTLGGNLKDMFETRARKRNGENWEQNSWQNITWKLKGSETTLEDFCLSLGAQDGDKEYIFEGSAWGKTIDVTVFLHKSPVKYVKDINVKAMRYLPTYVTAVFEDESEEILTNVEIILPHGRVNKVVQDTDENGGQDTDENGGQDTDENGQESDDNTQETVKYANNAYVMLGGTKYEFKVMFEDEALTADTLVLNAFDYQDKLNALNKDGIITIKVNDTFYKRVSAVFDFEKAEDKDGNTVNLLKMSHDNALKPATYYVNVNVEAGTECKQHIKLEVQFTPFEIIGIKRKALNSDSDNQLTLSYIETDLIEYAQKGVFQDGEEITVVGKNGKKDKKGNDILVEYTATVDWDRTESGSVKGVKIDRKGGQYIASATVNKGEYNEWTLYGIEVTVLPIDIMELADYNKEIVFDWKYYFYGGVEDYRCITSLLDFNVGGYIRKDVPVTIDVAEFVYEIDKLYANAKNGDEESFDCPITIDAYDEEGKLIFESMTIKVTLPRLKMSLTEDDNSVVIDVTDVYYKGVDVFFFNKNQMKIMIGDDEVTANVTWDISSVNAQVDGEYTVKVYIDKGGDHEQVCNYKVIITGNTQSHEEVQ